MRHRHSDYMYWARTQSRVRFNLATSGVGGFPFSDLPFDGGLEINCDSAYGYRPLLRAIAAKSGADPDCVVTAAGASMANHLAMAAMIDEGDEVLIEHPAYELLVSTPNFWGPTSSALSGLKRAGTRSNPRRSARRSRRRRS